VLLQNPLFLWSILALAIPLAIHLWNRKKPKNIYFGSIAWLISSQNKRFNSLSLHQILLWLLRSLILILLTLILTDLSFPQKVTISIPAKKIYISPGLLNDAAIWKKTKEMIKKGDQVHLLSHAFPAVDTTDINKNPKYNKDENYWSLLKELALNPQTPSKIKVITDDYAKHFQGSRPTIDLSIEWELIPGKKEQYFITQALKIKDSLLIQIGINQSLSSIHIPYQNIVQYKDYPEINIQRDSIFFKSNPTEKIKIKEPQPVKIIILYTPEFEEDIFYLESALEVIKTYTKKDISVTKKLINEITTSSELQENFIFVLSKEQVKLQRGTLTKLIEYKDLNESNFIIPNYEQGIDYYLTERLQARTNPEIFTKDLTENILFTLFSDLTTEKTIKDHAHLPITQIETNLMGKKNSAIPESEKIHSWQVLLWCLLSITFLLERWYTYWRT